MTVQINIRPLAPATRLFRYTEWLPLLPDDVTQTHVIILYFEFQKEGDAWNVYIMYKRPEYFTGFRS